MSLVPGIFAVLLATIGGYYLFVSPAAARLAEFEGDAVNRKRVRLRRVGGMTMVLLSLALFGIFFGYQNKSPWTMLIAMAAVFVLLVLLLVMAVIDVRLTQKLRDRQRKKLIEPVEESP